MFDYIQNIRSHRAVPCTWDIMRAVMRSAAVGSTCAEIADLREKRLRGELGREDFEAKKSELKRRLPAFCFHAHFKNGRRLNQDAVPSGLSMLDIDHISLTPSPSPKGEGSGMPLGSLLIGHALRHEPIKDADMNAMLKRLGIVLVHLTPSAEGLRLVFVLGDGETPQQGQKRLAAEMGLDKFDEACKDLARCSFAVPCDYVLYIDKDNLFADHANASSSGESIHKPQPNWPAQGPATTLNDNGNNNSSGTAVSHAPVASGQAAEPVAVLSQNLRIFDEAVESAGLTIDNLNAVGTRHNSLITILSMGICRLMPQEQLRAVVAERMPEYSREKDCQDLMRDFYAKYTDPNRPMSGQLRRIYTDSLKAAGGSAGCAPCGRQQGGKPDNAMADGRKAGPCVADEDIDIDPDPVVEGSSASRHPSPPVAASERLSEELLPPGLRETLAGVPGAMRMPVLCAVLPLAACYADGVTVRYCDGAVQRLGLMSIIVGPQASGKSACKRKVDLWVRQMADEDARAREIEDQWKEAKKSRKANEKAPDDPMVLIRSVPATISCSTLLRRFKNSRGHCLWTFCEELDTLRKTNGAGSWSSKYDIYRLGFDYGEWGQDYNSDQAVSGVVNVAYNFSILGTYGALRKCFRSDNVENGLSSRVIISEMPDAAFAPMPAYGQPASDSAAAIDRAVTLLRSQTGFVDTPRLREAIGEWVEEKRVEAMADGDLVKDTYRKRAAVIGFRCGVVARLLEGRESDAVAGFATMMAQYVLDEQLRVFGESLRAEYKKASDEQQRPSANHTVFDQLPPVFTLQDLRQLKGPDISILTLRAIISRWKSAEWIAKTAKNQWRKLENIATLQHCTLH